MGGGLGERADQDVRRRSQLATRLRRGGDVDLEDAVGDAGSEDSPTVLLTHTLEVRKQVDVGCLGHPVGQHNRRAKTVELLDPGLGTGDPPTTLVSVPARIHAVSVARTG